ncbi:hypothetical protein [Halomonas halmophila]|uniref:DUF4440 domain-containing protein n=1 Tax=Halomonas halmophila TaxID=252 RepID=A0A4Y4EXR0_9GAMM|nr:hypothetical protein [Halomonas halmophila]GED22732.1 hypothetical protein HHA01_17090 [Halomonas halmophila]
MDRRPILLKGAALASLLAMLSGSLNACAPITTAPERQEGSAATDNKTVNAATDPVSTSKRYFRHLEKGAFDQAFAMWSPDSPVHEGGNERFRQSMLAYQSFDGKATGAARMEGAAGTLYAEVPIQVSGAHRGQPFTHQGTMTLKRCNGVPGCSAQERQWQIASIILEQR